MFIKKDSIDDIIRECLTRIMKDGEKISPTTKGDNREIRGVNIELSNPRSRLSLSHSRGKNFSPIGELVWYLSGSDKLDFIRYYINLYSCFSDDGSKLHGAYGKRIFAKQSNLVSQFENVYNILSKKKNTRQAVIQILQPEDLYTKTKDLPCTISLQFFIRNNRLYMYTLMRSNDIFKGFTHDLFCFTFIQEYLAKKLQVGLGSYNHYVTSLHLYESDMNTAKQYLDEGFQSIKNSSMPEMPAERLTYSVKSLLSYEELIRKNKKTDLDKECNLDPYWKDLILMLEAFSYWRKKDTVELETISSEIRTISSKLNHAFFKAFIQQKLNMLNPQA